MKTPIPPHDNVSKCWMTDDGQVERETQQVYGDLVAALDYGEQFTPQAVAVFTALMTMACHLFAQASVTAGDDDALIARHVDGVMANFKKQVGLSVMESRTAIVPTSRTMH